MSEESTTTFLVKKANQGQLIEILNLSYPNDEIQEPESSGRFAVISVDSYEDMSIQNHVFLKDKALKLDFDIWAIKSTYMQDEVFYRIEEGNFTEHEIAIGDIGEDVTKVYKKWHKGLGKLWFGQHSKEEIKEKSASKFGSFNSVGKKLKKVEIPDLHILIKNKDDFLKANIEIPYASPYWDRYIRSHSTIAMHIATITNYAPESDSFRYERTYIFKRHNGDTKIGYVYTWTAHSKRVLYSIAFVDDCVMDDFMIVGNEHFSIDETIAIGLEYFEGYGLLEPDSYVGETGFYNYFLTRDMHDPYASTFLNHRMPYQVFQLEISFKILKKKLSVYCQAGDISISDNSFLDFIENHLQKNKTISVIAECGIDEKNNVLKVYEAVLNDKKDKFIAMYSSNIPKNII